MKTLAVNTSRPYEIKIGRGSLDQAGVLCRQAIPNARKLTIVTDSRVLPLYLARTADSLMGGEMVDSQNDHRIAMMAAVSAQTCQKPVTILGAECVNKSYPNFWEHFQVLGGNIHGLVLR